MYWIASFRLNKLFATIFIALSSLVPIEGLCATPPITGKVLFLGDSITYAGEYVNLIETAWRMQSPNTPVDVLNLGLPSETVSGLSEPGHAGGAFPRPDLHERLVRVLDQVHPNVVVACYGMNDGIYHPLSNDRFQAYKTGIKKLIEEAKRREINLVLLTPAYFDALPIKERLLPAGRDTYPQPYIDYDDVLQNYTDWLLGLRTKDISVIDIHRAMKEAVQSRREKEASFTFAPDGVHPNSDGHRIIAEAVAKEWNLELSVNTSEQRQLQEQLLRLVSERQLLLKHSWLSATKHNRPGIEPGIPVEQATKRALEIENEISRLLSKS
ncbi:MAG: SGNH/GDSL hydrolase family protein [Pirellula sp.]|jgi:lysophospholipase L1-like esterase|nr:SGNH/GDSL hydrolase family protein [Pirellula sp.]